jgi:hypothetical protein
MEITYVLTSRREARQRRLASIHSPDLLAVQAKHPVEAARFHAVNAGVIIGERSNFIYVMWHTVCPIVWETCWIRNEATPHMRENKVTQDGTDIMEKARAKRRRRAARKVRNAGKNKANPSDAGLSLTEKVVDLAQGTVAQVGALVKSAAHKITGA